MQHDWSWVISAAIAAIITSLIRSLSMRLTLLEKEVRFLREKLGISPAQITSWPPTPNVSPVEAGTLAEVESLIQQGKIINAIKAYREQTGAGLKDAKDAVEAMEQRMKYGM